MSNGEQERNGEILRLRERVHALEASVRGLSWRLRLQGEHVKELRDEMRGVREDVAEILRAEDIAEAVAQKMKERNALLTTWPRRLGAFAAGAIVLAESLKGLVGH